MSHPRSVTLPRLLAMLALLGWLASAAAESASFAELPPYTRTVLTTPRPVVLHVLAVDLAGGLWEPVAVIAADPDGVGPAQSRLASPLDLAQVAGVQAAINANAFSLLPDTPSDEPLVEGLSVLVNGLAATRARVVSRPKSSNNVALWSDDAGAVQVGYPSPKERVREGVAGFGWLLRDGTAKPAEDGKRHPRTAVALDRERKTLWLVVVDGRQPGYSDGMSLRELAVFLRSLGAWNAANLDGGGSSVMLLANEQGQMVIANRPSNLSFFRRVPRPVPVLLGIRRIPRRQGVNP